MAAFPSMITLTNRVLNECGIPSAASNVFTANQRSAAVVNAANDFVNEVYLKAEWPWRKTTTFIPLVSGQTDYPLPANFQSIATVCSIDGIPLDEMDLQTYDTTIAVTVIPPSQGIYGAYTIDDGVLRLAFTPGSTLVGKFVKMNYFKDIPDPVTADSYPLDLDYSFYPCVIAYCKAKLKQQLEYPDWKDDWQESQRLLAVQLAARRKNRKHPQIKLLGC